MEHRVVVVANADLQRRMKARAIHRFDRVPEALDVVAIQVGDAGLGLGASRGHRLEIVGDVAEPAERTEGLPHPRSLSRSRRRRKELFRAVAGERARRRLLSVLGAERRQ
jgi:hypothetical protein